MSIQTLMQRSPVIPVLVIERLEDAVPLATALYEGGLEVLEVTLRTEVALSAIAEIAKALPQAMVGAGTVVNAQQLDQALAHGAQFIVSPGCTTALAQAAKDKQALFLPGVNSPSEAMALLDLGFDCLKFFPAEAAGGVAMLKAMGGPLPQLTFCPTGGINLDKAPEYLALKNVACVGGSWMLDKDHIQNKRWDKIKSLAMQAAQLGKN